MMSEGLEKSTGLNEPQLEKIRQLEKSCNEFEGLTMKLNWDLLRSRPKQLVNDFFYYADDRLAGYLALYTFNEREAEVSAMTRPGYRRQGIFRQLLAAAGQELRKRGVDNFLFICEQTSKSGLGCMKAIDASYAFSEYRMDLVEPVQSQALPAELQIRPAYLEDVDALAQMDAICFNMSPFARKAQLTRSLADSRRKSLIATIGPTAIGKVHVTNEQDGAAYISAFCVLPEYRSRGYGKAILADTVRQLIDERYQSISLEVATENRHALSLYEQCGFAVTTAYDYYRLAVSEWPRLTHTHVCIL